MTHSMLLMATEVATRCRRPLRLVCSAMGISNSNVRRWLSRLRNGEPLINQRGPKVFTSADMNEAIQFDLRGLIEYVERVGLPDTSPDDRVGMDALRTVAAMGVGGLL